ncbi:MAG: helix-turn-helix transcriptional regulator [Acidobacteriia bacterium]|nr:helix-turn-helix transcriptional regulator [Terriglobia bacterium]
MAKHYKKFSELQSKMSPEQRKQNEAEAERMMRELPLDELRAARNLTQEHLAKIMGVKQSAISRMERRADVYVSTLSSFIEAMGGHLEIRAVFPEGAVLINQFGEERPSTAD